MASRGSSCVFSSSTVDHGWVSWWPLTHSLSTFKVRDSCWIWSWRSRSGLRCARRLVGAGQVAIDCALLLSHTMCTVAFNWWYWRNKFEMIVMAIWPCNSPLVEERSGKWPSTGPDPYIERRGFSTSSTWPVEMIHAWEAWLSLKDASLAPYITLLWTLFWSQGCDPVWERDRAKQWWYFTYWLIESARIKVGLWLVFQSAIYNLFYIFLMNIFMSRVHWEKVIIFLSNFPLTGDHQDPHHHVGVPTCLVSKCTWCSLVWIQYEVLPFPVSISVHLVLGYTWGSPFRPTNRAL